MTAEIRDAANPDPLHAPGFWRRHLVVPFVAWAAVAAVFETTSLDLTLSNPFYDPAQRTFPLRNGAVVLAIYFGGRFVIVGIAVASLAVCGASFRWARWRVWRRAGLYVALAIGMSAGIVALLKLVIDRGTPYAYVPYGGPRPFAPLFSAVPTGVPPVHEFPAAHASGAFALLALYFVALSRGVRRPALWLVPGMGLGIGYSMVQHVRGMHFASHDWWTLGIAWCVCLALFAAFRGRT